MPLVSLVASNSNGLTLGNATVDQPVRSTKSYSMPMIYLITPSSGWRVIWPTSGEVQATCPGGHPFKSTAPDFGGSQTIVTSGSTIPVVSSTPTLSFDIGLFTLEEYGIYATSGLPLTYSTNNASVLDVDSATGKLDPKGAGSVTITISQAGDSHFSAASNATLNVAVSQDRSQTIDLSGDPRSKCHHDQPNHQPWSHRIFGTYGDLHQ